MALMTEAAFWEKGSFRKGGNGMKGGKMGICIGPSGMGFQTKEQRRAKEERRRAGQELIKAVKEYGKAVRKDREVNFPRRPNI